MADCISQTHMSVTHVGYTRRLHVSVTGGDAGLLSERANPRRRDADEGDHWHSTPNLPLHAKCLLQRAAACTLLLRLSQRAGEMSARWRRCDDVEACDGAANDASESPFDADTRYTQPDGSNSGSMPCQPPHALPNAHAWAWHRCLRASRESAHFGVWHWHARRAIRTQRAESFQPICAASMENARAGRTR